MVFLCATSEGCIIIKILPVNIQLVQFIQMAITRIDSLNTMDYEVLPRTVKLD
uniref:Uncharacterized protein n=1 Tax=Anguilla anguilla TaxID=7936 RepID=A0A0E9SQW4_ANGAN